MLLRRAIDSLVVWLACATCVLFLCSLSDTFRVRLTTHALAPAPPAHVPRIGRVVATVTDAQRGVPVKGADVRAFWERAGAYYDAGAGTTNAAGLVELEDVPEGKLWILAEAPGFARASTQTVARGQEPSHVDFRLDAGHQLRVTVRTEQGEPLGGATVLVHTSDPLPFGAVTQPRGNATLGRLPRPSWSVRVSAQGFESVMRHDVSGSLDVVLRRLGTLEVQVLTEVGQPAAGAEVWISGSALWPPRRSTTQPNGTLVIVGLLAGQYELRASLGDSVSSSLAGIELERGEDHRVTLRLQPGRRVSVDVYDEASSPREGIGGADVVLVEQGLSPFPLRGRTDPEGHLSLGPISFGPAFVSVRADGFVPSNAVPVPDGLEGPLAIGLLRGATLRGRVVDERGFPVSSASIEIVGSDLGGLPVAETPWSNAFRDTHFEWSLGGPLPLVQAGELGVIPGAVPPIPRLGTMGDMSGLMGDPTPVTAWVSRDTGYFAVNPVTPGRVRALVRHPAYLPGLSELVQLVPGGSAEVTVVLRGGSSLEGRVLDAGGMPAAGARVEIQGQTGLIQRTTYTASDGTFAFAAVPERIVISVARPEDPMRAVIQTEVDLVAHGGRELVLHLPEAREPIEVLVTDERDAPLEGAQVLVASLDPEVPLRRTVFTGTDGRVEIEDVRGLRLSVTADVPGWLAEQRSFDQAPDRITVVMARGFSAVGHVTAVRGRQYLAGASVTLIQGGRRRTVVTDAAGAYRLSDVEPGAAKLFVSHAEYAPLELDVLLTRPAREDRDQELPDADLAQGTTASGIVVDSNGKPVMGARVALGQAPAFLPLTSGGESSTLTDVQGAWSLGGLPDGSVTIEARAEGLGYGRTTLELREGRPATGARITLGHVANQQDTASASLAPASVAVTLIESAEGVSVAQIAAGSEAERAGLQRGDLLKRVDGLSPRNVAEARARLSGPLGTTVLIDVIRGGAVASLRVVREPVRH